VNRSALAIARLFPAAWLLAGCGAAPSSEHGPRVAFADSAGVQLVRNLDRPADTTRMGMVEELRIGAADGHEEEMFHFVRGVATDAAGRIFVIDDGSRVIRLFDADGRFVRRIGQRGSGPGEFTSIAALVVRGDTVHALDLNRHAGAFFDAAGTLLRTYASMRSDRSMLRLMAAGPSGWYADPESPFLRPPLELGAEQVYWTHVRRIDMRQLDAALASAAAADSVMVPVVSYPFGRSIGFLGSEGGSTRGVFGGRPFFDPTGSSTVDGRGYVYVTAGWPLSIDVYDADGTMIRRISRAHDSIPVTPDLVDEVLRRARTYYDTLPQRASWMHALVEQSKMPRLGWVPAASTLRASSDGWLWVRRRDLEPDPVLHVFSSGSPPPPAYWDVFDPEGVYRYTLRMPYRFAPHVVGPDHVVGVQRDEWDVEYVVRYAIRPVQ
jgi:hypothetical protein